MYLPYSPNQFQHSRLEIHPEHSPEPLYPPGCFAYGPTCFQMPHIFTFVPNLSLKSLDLAFGLQSRLRQRMVECEFTFLISLFVIVHSNFGLIILFSYDNRKLLITLIRLHSNRGIVDEKIIIHIKKYF